MGLYDDGGVKYAEGVFQASRERIDKKIKEKEKKGERKKEDKRKML